jgi:predicted pyridoxine 5'-phosphate oxidase superfamily flavin-nucleotide-binding protein
MPVVALTDEMKEVLHKNNKKFIAVPMATASKEGVPNVAPMASVWLRDDATLWICDNFMVKTLHNLQENPIAAFFFWDADTKRCFQIKGSAEVKTSGADYEEMYAMVKKERPSFPAKSLIVVTITGVFDCTPGKNAGNQIQ